MPFYLRKSVSAGPFRFNFSKSGMGVSVGVKGLRFGTGPRGHYMHAGRGGLYYRATLGRAGTRKASHPSVETWSEPIEQRREEAGVEMVEIESDEVLHMRDEAFGELLDEINEKQRQLKMSTLLASAFGGLALLMILIGVPFSGWFLLAIIPGWMVGNWLDSYRRTTVLFYDLEDDVRANYEEMIRRFDGLTECAGKWHVAAGGSVHDIHTWKRNAGAAYLVQKKVTSVHYALPAVLKSNLTPPSVHAGRQVLYFMPDVLLVGDGGRFGAVGYDKLQMDWQDSNFIEEGSVPRDAEIIYHTWKHPNKGGGPDRRFANNYQIPVCRYEAMHLRSATGLNELIEFSRTGVSEPFIDAVTALGRSLNQARSVRPRLSGPVEA
jgi:hypothetical protein